MPIRQFYSIAETKAAIERADGRNINQLKMVRSDISNQQFAQKTIKVANRTPGVPADLQYPGARDVGHVFRHVAGTGAAGKSIYKGQQTAIAVTREMLNSSVGQAMLQELEDELPRRALYNNTTKRLRVDISGSHYYGSHDNGATWKKIKVAQCELLALGQSLWVHSSYPRELV